MDRQGKSPRHGDDSEGEGGTADETKPLLIDEQYGEPVGDGSTQKRGMSRGRLFVVGSVLVTELCERLTYYSVVANLVLFCTSVLKYSSDDASVVTLVFTGTVYIIPVFGGFVADAWAGKYNTIFGSGLIYLLGLFLLPASAVNYKDWFGGDEDLSLDARKAFFFSGLTLISLGTGGIKANVGPFGAQQVEDLGKDAIQSFFNWFYWFINVGAIIAYSAVAYVQQEQGFDYGFSIPFISMLIAQIVFFLGKSKYIHTIPEGSVLIPSIGVCMQSCSTCPNPSFNRARKTFGGRYDNEMVDGVRAVVRVLPVFLFVVVYWAVYNQVSHPFYWFINVGAIIAYSAVAYVQQEQGFDYGFSIPFISMLIAQIVFFLGKSKYIHTIPEGSVLIPSIGVCMQSCSTCPNPSFNRARKTFGGRYDNEMVDGVRAVVRVLPVFLFVVVYWAVYNQMSTSLFLQTERMDISIGSFRLPAAVLNIFNTLIILILIPIMDLGVYPLLAKFGRSPTLLQRMGIGMVLAACAMLYAGMIEIVRKDDIQKHGYINQTLADDMFNASKISMFAQIPEFAFIGSSEVFTSISGLEFAYTQAPQFMQGLIMGLFLMTSGIGSYIASLIIAIVKLWYKDEKSDWYPKEPNNGHLEYLFFLLGVLTFVNLLAFIFVAKWYKYKNDPEEQPLIDGEVVPSALSDTSFEKGSTNKVRESTSV